MFEPYFHISHEMTQALTDIERARGFLDGALLPQQWLAHRQHQMLLSEAQRTSKGLS